jgi:hypothetical protein
LVRYGIPASSREIKRVASARWFFLCYDREKSARPTGSHDERQREPTCFYLGSRNGRLVGATDTAGTSIERR